MKKLAALLLAGAMVFNLAACGANGSTNSGDTATGTSQQSSAEAPSGAYDFSKVKIGVIGFFESGENLDAITAYLDELSANIGFRYEYVAGSSYDEQTNITTAQNLIASGCNGIIMCMDSGTEAIMEECASAKVYMAGFLCDMESSLDKIKDNPYYLGNVCDGFYDNGTIGEKAAELLIADGNTNVGIVTFPLNYYPNKALAIDAFTSKIAEHNQTAAEEVEIYETVELSFSPLEDTYFQDYPELDSIFGLASGFVHPTMVSAGKTDISLYTTGFKKDDVDAFHDGSIRMMTLSNTEALVYPLAMILNEVSGQPYADKPATGERVDTSTIFITSDEEMNALVEKCFYCTNDMADAFIDAEGFKSYLTAYNSDATYEELTSALLKMSMEDIMAK